MDLIEGIKSRRSIRLFKPDPVPQEKLEKAFEVAKWAPIANIFRNYEYYVLQGESLKKALKIIGRNTYHLRDIFEELQKYDPDWVKKAINFYSELGGAPCLIVVVAPRPQQDEEMEMSCWDCKWGIIEPSLETCLLLLALSNERLGACGIGMAPWVEDKVAELIGLGDDKQVLFGIAVGYPDEDPKPHPHQRVQVNYLD